MSKIDITPRTRKCCKCGKKWGLERHHVTYKPPLIKDLCSKCHKKITEINTVAAKLYGTHKTRRTKFTNVVRLALWRVFLVGKGKDN